MNQHALDNAIQLHPDLWKIENLLSESEMTELLKKISSQQNWQTVNLQEYSNRQQIPWETNGVCDWLFCNLANLDFSKFNLKIRTVTVWKDTTGYKIEKHADNDRVIAAMQIYISPTHLDLGTCFLNNIEIPFIQNTGYLMHNRNQLEHKMTTPVPEGYSRLSFYVLFDENI